MQRRTSTAGVHACRGHAPPALPRRIRPMKRTRWPALLVLLFPGAASAQFFVPGGGIDLGFGKVRKHGGFFLPSRGHGGFYGPVLVNPYGPPVSRVRIT